MDTVEVQVAWIDSDGDPLLSEGLIELGDGPDLHSTLNKNDFVKLVGKYNTRYINKRSITDIEEVNK